MQFEKISPFITAATSLALLGGAHAFERLGGLVPCQLCYYQRDTHWTGLFISVLLIIAVARKFRPSMISALFALLVLAYVLSTGAAGYHAGVELKWWPGPASCSGGVGSVDMTVTDLLQSLKQAAAAPACDEIPWALFGLSMAVYNALISLGLTALAALGLRAHIK